MCHPGEGAHGDPKGVMSKTRNPGIQPSRVSPGVPASQLTAGGKSLDVDAAPLAREAGRVSGAASAATKVDASASKGAVGNPAGVQRKDAAPSAGIPVQVPSLPTPAKAPEAPTYADFIPVRSFLVGVLRSADIIAKLAADDRFLDAVNLVQETARGERRDDGLISLCNMVGYTADIPTPINMMARVEIENSIVDIRVAVMKFREDEVIRAQAVEREATLAAQQQREQERCMFESLDNVFSFPDENLTAVIAGCESDFADATSSAQAVLQSSCIEILLEAGGFDVPEAWACNSAIVAKAMPTLMRCSSIARNVLKEQYEGKVSRIIDLISVFDIDAYLGSANADLRALGSVELMLSNLGHPAEIANDPRVFQAVSGLIVNLKAKIAEIKVIDRLSEFFGSKIPASKLRKVAIEHMDEIIGLNPAGSDEERVAAVRKLAEWFKLPLGDVMDFSRVKHVKTCVDSLVGTVQTIEDERTVGVKANTVRDQLGAVSEDDRAALAALYEERLLELGKGGFDGQIQECFDLVRDVNVSPAFVDFADTTNVVVKEAVRDFLRDLLQRAGKINEDREKVVAKELKVQSVFSRIGMLNDSDRDRLVVAHRALLLDYEPLHPSRNVSFLFTLVRDIGVVDEDITDCVDNPALVGAVKGLMDDLHNRAVAIRLAKEQTVVQLLGEVSEADKDRFAGENEARLMVFDRQKFVQAADRWFVFVRSLNVVPADLFDCLVVTARDAVVNSVVEFLDDLKARAGKIKATREEAVAKARVEAEEARLRGPGRIIDHVVGIFDTPDYLGSVVSVYADDMEEFTDQRAFGRNPARWVGVFVQVVCLQKSDADLVLKDDGLRQLASRVLVDLKNACCAAVVQAARSGDRRQRGGDTIRSAPSLRGVRSKTSQESARVTGTESESVSAPVAPVVLNTKIAKDVLNTMRRAGGLQSRRGAVEASWTNAVEAACNSVLRGLGLPSQGSVSANQRYILSLVANFSDNLPEALKFDASTGLPLNQPARR